MRCRRQVVEQGDVADLHQLGTRDALVGKDPRTGAEELSGPDLETYPVNRLESPV
jgi:hypothetical protein